VKRETRLLVLLLLLAFGLRLWGLADHNIWWDEGVGAYLARLPVAELLNWAAHDVHPPLHYLILRAWWLVTGDGEYLLRFPSVMAGTLGVALLYRLGRALGGRRAGLVAALFLALSRFSITWSQEIRMYIWAATFGTAALWMAARFWRRGDWRSWAGYAVAVAASLWTLYLTAVVPLAASVGFLVLWLRRGRPRRLLVKWAAAQLAAVGLILPWLAYSLGRMPTWSSAEPVSPLEFLRLYATMLAVGVPVNVETYWLPTVVSLAILAVGLVCVWRGKRSADQTAAFGAMLAGVVLPALIVFVFALPIEIPFGRLLAPRYFLPLAVCFYALLGWGLASLAQRLRWTASLAIGLAISVTLLGLVSLYPGRARRDDLVSLTAALKAHRGANDAVLLHTDKDWPLFAAQYAGGWQGVPYGAAIDQTGVDALLAPLWSQSQAVWLVTTPDAQRLDPTGLVRAWLEERAEAAATWSFAENELAIYARVPGRAEVLHDLAPGFTVPDDVSRELAPGVTLLGSWLGLPRYLVGDTAHLLLFWNQAPAGEVRVGVLGSVEKWLTAGPPQAASAGVTRQQIDLPLTPDLTPGSYCLRVCLGQLCAEGIGCFDLVRRTTAPAVAPGDVGHPVDVRLGEAINLLGYELTDGPVEPGGTVELTLFWQAEDVIEERYKGFTHLVGEVWNESSGNFLWGQVDSEPLNYQAPTTIWVPGQVIADSYRIPVAPGAPAGVYTLEVGLYGLVDGGRLPVFDSSGERVGDSVTLAQVEVQDP